MTDLLMPRRYCNTSRVAAVKMEAIREMGGAQLPASGDATQGSCGLPEVKRALTAGMDGVCAFFRVLARRGQRAANCCQRACAQTGKFMRMTFRWMDGESVVPSETVTVSVRERDRFIHHSPNQAGSTLLGSVSLRKRGIG